jgi:hypothetical protein
MARSQALKAARILAPMDPDSICTAM